MRTAEEMIMELDSALLFGDVKKLMIQYAKEALEEAAELCSDWEELRGEHRAYILDTIKELK